MSAPLITLAGAPVPPGAEADWSTRPDGARLRAALFTPAGVAHGSVVLSGGRTEPIEKYFEVIEELLGRGLAVLAHDWRGQGLSHRAQGDRLKCHVDSHEELVADLIALVGRYEARLPRPRIAFGHSLGGCVTLLALSDGALHRFDGCILSAPMVGLQTGPIPPVVVRLAARVQRALGRGDRYGPGGPGTPFDEPFEVN